MRHKASTPSIKSAITLILIGSIISLTACQSTPTAPVMQRANSTYETTGLGETKVDAQRQALQSANATCGMRDAIVISNDVVYNGILDARAGRMIDQVGSVVGSVLGTSSPDLARDDDYEYTINFRCQ